jgi:cytochrome b pre-mRNA-processing protein 3
MPWLRPDPARQSAEHLYAVLVAQARRPEFYSELGVPDTLDGRFELVALHTFLALRRLKSDASAADTRQALVDVFVDDMDASLREMGAGDLGVGRRVKAMAQALYGRIAAYEAGLGGPEQALVGALRRNVYGTAADAAPDLAKLEKLATYVRRESTTPWHDAEGLRFGPPPGPAPETGQEQRR